MEEPRGEIVIYESAEGGARVEVRLEENTVWLTQAQMVELFQTTKQNISLHIGNIFKEAELNEDSVVKEYLTTAADGKSYRTKFYNLDVIISVGYRIKSRRGTDFRIWATNVLRDHIIKGYTINQRRLSEQAEHYSFSDGNKRIAAAIFLWFLDGNRLLYAEDGHKRLGDNALVALTLMIAESKPQHKDVIIKVIVNLINKDNP